MARKNRGDYVPAAYDDDSLPRVGDVFRSGPAPTNPDPTGTKEYQEQRARFDARQKPQAEEPSPLQKPWDTIMDYLDAKDKYLKDPS